MQDYLPSSTADLVLLAVLVISAIFAMYRGFIREFLAIISWVAAFVITIYFFNPANVLMLEIVPNDMIAAGLTGILLFIVSLVVFSLIAATLSDIIHKTPLSSVDRLLGLFFGVVRGGLIICLLYFGVSWAYAGKPMPTWVTDSKSLPIVKKSSEYLTTLVPEGQRIELVKMLQNAVTEGEDDEIKGPTNLGKPSETGPIIKKIVESPTKIEDTEAQLPSHEVHKGERALDDPVHAPNYNDKSKKVAQESDEHINTGD